MMQTGDMGANIVVVPGLTSKCHGMKKSHGMKIGFALKYKISKLDTLTGGKRP